MNWFEVSKEGLRELQMGKPKFHVARELIQNAWDEDINVCNMTTQWSKGYAVLIVEDDSELGFRDIKDSYTLFGHTYKRADPTKRGRFNVGEKQAFSICTEAIIETTKGTVVFNRKGRTIKRKKRDRGTSVTVKFKCKKSEYNEIIEEIKSCIVPKEIRFLLNGEVIEHIESYKSFEAGLQTEIESDGILKRTKRKTMVDIYKNNESKLYEMGLPIMNIDHSYSINIQQKVPMSIDRESVLPSFLKTLYAEVLNHTHEDIKKEDASQLWIRNAMSSDRINKDAVKEIITKRFGDKVCVANPFDRSSIDEAISRGFNVVYGSEMSGEEWGQIKEHNPIQSSTELFGTSFADAIEVKDLTRNQEMVKRYAKRIAKRLLDINLRVTFIESKATCEAQYSSSRLTFNLSRLPSYFFNEPVSAITTDLILHELAHEYGLHTEKSYLQAITRMAGELVMIALKEKKFFNIR